jgi:hypothetical protein
MHKCCMVCLGMLVFGLGIIAGSHSFAPITHLQANQDAEQATQFSSEVVDAYGKANKGVRELTNLFVANGNSTSAFGGMNYFGASVGGIDAERDLEEGRGVDPETFAALYADQASAKVSQHLDYDAEGRLRYKKNVIRIYSRDRLKQLFDLREQLEARAEAGQ